MTLTKAVSLAVTLGLLLAVVTPTVLRRLPEPVDLPPQPPEPAGSDTGEIKIPYAALATRRFGAGVGLIAVPAILIPGVLLPFALVPPWLVLGTVGLLLAAIDARTTWLPLSLTRVAWVTMIGALTATALLGTWAQAARGLGGFALAGAVFGAAWLLTRGGFGFGDVRYAPLVGAATAAVSWTVLAWALVLGSLAGAAVGLVRLAAGRRGAFAYAPAILTGAYLAVVAAWLTT